mgnify:CR=1 FL=1
MKNVKELQDFIDEDVAPNAPIGTKYITVDKKCGIEVYEIWLWSDMPDWEKGLDNYWNRHFPLSRFKDQVDAASMAFDSLGDIDFSDCCFEVNR